MSKIKKKIEKLLNLSLSDNQHEAQLELDRAVKLMQEHNITKEEIYKQQFTQEKFDTGFKRIPEWALILYSEVSRVSGCIFSYGGGRAAITGRERDVLNALYLCDFMIREVNNKAKTYKKENQGIYKPSFLRRLISSYKIGVVRSVVITIEEKQKVFFSSKTNGDEVVPVDSRHEDAKAHLESLVGRLKPTKRKAKHDLDTLRHGYTDGESIDANPAVSSQDEICRIGGQGEVVHE